jgi:phosphoribosylformylglycinamidine synthase subunit PurQ / glutaminase
MKKPIALILRTGGTNCDLETEAAFALAGAEARRVHINRIISGEEKLGRYQILAFPGGFSYGDDIASGKILANEIKYKLAGQMREFAASGKPVIGICNGFQVLVKMGVLPDAETMEQTTTLTFNNSDKFECRWVYLKNMPKNSCLWTKNLPDMIQLPVAHGEGKFIARDAEALRTLEENGQVALRYCGPDGKKAGYPYNPNGSENNIAGICNRKGNIFGLMPHPERFIYTWQQPGRHSTGDKNNHGWGLQIFKNAVEHCS